MEKKGLTNEYIRGLVEGEGCFTFHSNRYSTKKGIKTRKIPAFVIEMNERDSKLIEMVRDHLDLPNPIYNLRSPALRSKTSKGEVIYRRGRKARLCVREFESLKDIIIPFFYKKLRGHKGRQFKEWLEKIGSDPNVSDRYKSLHRLYKWGLYDTEPKFTKKFAD